MPKSSVEKIGSTSSLTPPTDQCHELPSSHLTEALPEDLVSSAVTYAVSRDCAGAADTVSVVCLLPVPTFALLGCSSGFIAMNAAALTERARTAVAAAQKADVERTMLIWPNVTLLLAQFAVQPAQLMMEARVRASDSPEKRLHKRLFGLLHYVMKLKLKIVTIQMRELA
jgi:hypothetical protein